MSQIRAKPNRESTTSTRRWVKAFGIIALIVILLLAILMFTSGPNGHGPRRHGSDGFEPFSAIMEGGGRL